MQGRLCRWALALQEYDFTIKYHKGTQNSNADALSRLPENTTAVTEVLDGSYTKQQFQSLQQKDPILNWVLSYLSENKQSSAEEQKNLPCYKRWLQIWPQLHIKDGMLFRKMKPLGYNSDHDVLVTPSTMRPFFLAQSHDSTSAGHMGFGKSLHRLREQAY